MTDLVQRIVRRTTIATAVVGAVLSPLPLVDELVLFPVYVAMAARIGKTHSLAFSQLPWKPICGTAVNGLLARAGANLAVSYVPGVAAVANAASAALLTNLLGTYFDDACRDPDQARSLGVRTVIEAMRSRAAEKARAAA